MTADATFWDKLAERYAAKPVDNEAAFARKQDVTRALLTPDSRVIEVGCGTGSLALMMAPHAAHIDAVDISGEMLRIARQKADDMGISNVSFHQAPCSDLPKFKPGHFQCAWAYSILHLVEDRPALLRELFELLEPGGVLVSSTPCIGGSLVPYWLILPVMRWAGQAPWVDLVTPDQVMQDMREAGFVDVTRREVGAKAQTAFVLAHRPGGTGTR